MNWELITKTIAILAAASGLIVWLAKAIFNQLLSRDIERYKTDLRAVHDNALERLRADLRIEAFAKETVFAKLHAKRVEVIQDLHKQIAVVSRTMNALMSPMQFSGGSSESEKAADAEQAAHAFQTYLSDNQIYFDEDLCNLLDAFGNKLWDAWVTYATYGSDEKGVERERRQTRFEAWKKLSDELPEIQRQIEKSFRKLLGQGG